MIDLIVPEKNGEKTIEGKIARFDGVTDIRSLDLKKGYVLRIDGTEEVVTRTEYDGKELTGLRTTKKREGKEVETIYRVSSTGELINLFSRRIYDHGNQS